MTRERAKKEARGSRSAGRSVARSLNSNSPHARSLRNASDDRSPNPLLFDHFLPVFSSNLARNQLQKAFPEAAKVTEAKEMTTGGLEPPTLEFEVPFMRRGGKEVLQLADTKGSSALTA